MANTLKNLKGTFHHSFKRYDKKDGTLIGVGSMYLVKGAEESIQAYLDICEADGFDMEKLLDADTKRYKFWSTKHLGMDDISIQFNMEGVDRETGEIKPYTFVKDEVESALVGLQLDSTKDGDDLVADKLAQIRVDHMVAKLRLGKAVVKRTTVDKEPDAEESPADPSENRSANPDDVDQTPKAKAKKVKIDDIGSK